MENLDIFEIVQFVRCKSLYRVTTQLYIYLEYIQQLMVLNRIINKHLPLL